MQMKKKASKSAKERKSLENVKLKTTKKDENGEDNHCNSVYILLGTATKLPVLFVKFSNESFP